MLTKQRVQWNVIVAAVLTLLAAFIAVLSVSVRAADNSTNTLKVTPVRSDIEVQPGKTKIVQTTITNLTDKEISVRAIPNDFVAGDEEGSPALILDENEYAPTHSLKRFMKPLGDMTIPAKSAKTIDVEINVPATAQAGGYFGAVRFAPTSAADGGQVNLSASVASLILLTVPGDMVEKINLTEFNIKQGDKAGSYFTSSNDLTAAFRFENKGNVQIGPLGKISVKKGNSIVYETDFNNKDQRDMILPDSARRWDVPLKKIGSFGRYTVTATFTYGKKNQTIDVERSFWVVPQGVIIATVVGVLFLLAVVISIVLFAKNRKLSGGGRTNFRR